MCLMIAAKHTHHPSRKGPWGMSSNARRANGYRRDQAAAWLRKQGRPCWICQEFGRPGFIDYSLPPGKPGSFEVDELVPVSKGGSPTDLRNLAAAHRQCNRWRSNRSVEEVRAIAKQYREKAALSGDVLGAEASDWL